MPEMHLRQPGFTYSAYGPFPENNERIKKIKKTGYSRYIHQYQLDKAYFQLDMVYGDFKDLNRRTAADKILGDNEFHIAKNQNMMEINVDLLQWFINFLMKKLLVEQLKMKLYLIKN